MKARKIGMFAGTFGALLLSTQAMAVFNPPAGADQLKLFDGSGFYTSTGVAEPRGDAFPDPGGTVSVAEAAAIKTSLVGTPGAPVVTQDFTAFQVTNLLLPGNVVFNIPTGTTVTGISTFLKVDDVTRISSKFLDVQIGDNSARGGNTPAVGPAGTVTIGRFFIYESTAADAGSFGTLGGEASDVQFTTTPGATTISSNGSTVFNTDVLTNFTGPVVFGSNVVSPDLLLTGSFIANDTDSAGDPVIDDILQGADNSTDHTLDGVSWSGGIGTTSIVIDGGTWFDEGIVPATGASFQIDQVGFDGTANPTPLHGTPDVYAGNWQVSSQDPVALTVLAPVPEPITAGLSTLAIAALAGYSTRRRKA